VLLVGKKRQRRHLGGAHVAHEQFGCHARKLGIIGGNVVQTLRAQAPDPGADKRVRHQATFDQVDRACRKQ
jgi:hypothetical protein